MLNSAEGIEISLTEEYQGVCITYNTTDGV